MRWKGAAEIAALLGYSIDGRVSARNEAADAPRLLWAIACSAPAICGIRRSRTSVTEFGLVVMPRRSLAADESLLLDTPLDGRQMSSRAAAVGGAARTGKFRIAVSTHPQSSSGSEPLGQVQLPCPQSATSAVPEQAMPAFPA